MAVRTEGGVSGRERLLCGGSVKQLQIHVLHACCEGGELLQELPLFLLHTCAFMLTV